MEGKEEERTVTFHVYHPCYFLQEALKSFLRCLGLETTMGSVQMNHNEKEEENSLPKSPSACASHPINVTPEIINSPSTSQKSSQEVATDPPASTITTQTLMQNASLMARRGPRRPSLSEGSPPQHN